MAAKGPADWATWTPGVCPQVQGAETYKRRAELTSNQQGPPPIPAQEAARTTTSHGMAAHTDTDEAPVVRSKYGVRLKSPPSVTFPSGRAATAVDSKPSGEATISKKSPAGLGPSSIRQTSKTIAEACWRYIMFGRCDKSDCNYIHVGRPAAEQQHQSNSQKLYLLAGSLYKTKVCRGFVDGTCSRAGKCHYIHLGGPDLDFVLERYLASIPCPYQTHLGDCLAQACTFDHTPSRPTLVADHPRARITAAESRLESRPESRPESSPNSSPESRPDHRPESRPKSRPESRPDLRPERAPEGGSQSDLQPRTQPKEPLWPALSTWLNTLSFYDRLLLVALIVLCKI